MQKANPHGPAVDDVIAFFRKALLDQDTVA
jgi:hypothetical protein